MDKKKYVNQANTTCASNYNFKKKMNKLVLLEITLETNDWMRIEITYAL